MPGWIELSGSCFGALVEAEREASCTKAHRKDKEISCSKHGGSVVYRSLRMLLRNVKALFLSSAAAPHVQASMSPHTWFNEQSQEASIATGGCFSLNPSPWRQRPSTCLVKLRPLSSWCLRIGAGNDWIKTTNGQQALMTSDQSGVLQPLTHQLWSLRLLSCLRCLWAIR